MKTKKLNCTAEPADEGWKFAAGPALDHDQQMALGIPEPSVAGQMKVVRKPARPARINIRTTHETIAGFTGAGGGSRATLPDTGRQRAAHGREGGVEAVAFARGVRFLPQGCSGNFRNSAIWR